MPEFFVVETSRAAPIFSDQDERYIEADDEKEALRKARKSYGHPAGLFSATAWRNADSFHKREPYLARWLCPRAEVITNGILCDCGNRTSISVGNSGPKGLTDIHRCGSCGAEWEVDMAAVNSGTPGRDAAKRRAP